MADRIVEVVITAKDAASKVVESLTASFEGLGLALAGAGTAMAAISGILIKAVNAASDQEEADVKLAQALATMGQNTAETRADLDRFTKSLQDSTKFGDVEIQNVLGLLSAIGRLKGEGLKEAAKAALDFATRTGRDAGSAAFLLAKAATGATEQLTRFGIHVTEGASNAQKFAEAIQQIEHNAGGAAEAVGKTFSGALQNVNEQMTEVLEIIGNAIIQDKGFRDALDEASAGLKRLGESAGTAGPQIVAIAKAIAISGGIISQIFLTAVNLASTVVLGWVKIFELAGLAVGKNVDALQNYADGLVAMGQGAVGAREEITKLIRILTSTNEQLPPVAAGIKNTGTGFEELADKGKKVEKVAKENIKPLREEIQVTAQAIMTAAEAMDIFVQHGRAVFLAFQDQVESAADTIGEAFRGQAVQGALQFGDALVDAAVKGKIRLGELFRQLLTDMAKAIVRALVLRAILSAIGGGGGAAAATYSGFAASEVPVGQGGGLVIGGRSGADSVAALLKPGEIILPTSVAKDFQTITDMARSGGSQAASGQPRARDFFGAFQILPRRDDAEAASLLDDLNRLVERRGYRLVASHVLP